MAGLPACTRPWRGGRRPRALVEVCGCLGLLAVACSWSLQAVARATSASDCFVPAVRWPSLDARRLGPGRASPLQLRAKRKELSGVLYNKDIRASEVRLVYEKSPTNPGQDLDEIMLTRDAMHRARELGLDVIQVDADQDPPKVWIMKKSVYEKEQRVSGKADRIAAKAPKKKEVKLSYAIGEHDLNVHCKRMENWFKDQDPRQQVLVKMIMKGRSKAFGAQGREVLSTLRRETAAFCKAQAQSGGEVVRVEKSGDMLMMMNAGPDMGLLSEMRKEAEEELVAGMEDSAEDKDTETEQGETKEEKALRNHPVAKEIAEVEKEMAEMKQELLECGIPPGQVHAEEEMRYLSSKLGQLQEKLEAALAGAKK